MRKVIAARLGESKQRIPHTYATISVKIDPCLALRAQLKAINFPVPSMNDLVIKASALALRATPKLNVQYAANNSNGVVQNMSVDVSVAVATSAGLITPIIRNADDKKLDQVSSEMKDLATRAKANKLKPSEFQGGSFTVSNLGMLGIADFTAICNLPQAGILAVGTGRQVFAAPAKATGTVDLGALQRETQMAVTLSFDASLVDPITASSFLQRFKSAIESPACLMA